MRILTFVNTIRFLKFSQIWNRLTIQVKRKFLIGYITRQIRYQSGKRKDRDFPKLDLVSKPSSKKISNANLTQLQFNFLNRSYTFQQEVEWNKRGLEKLWLYNLHYFEYLIPGTYQISPENYLSSKRIIQHWIDNNPIGYGCGWESYPLSLRIINWIFFFDAYHTHFRDDPKFKATFLHSLYEQASFLNWFIEYHIQANHLFENIKSMFFSSVFFQDQKWFKKSIRLLEKQLKEQILPDGGHYELSPMYHLIILTDILDIINLIKSIQRISDPDSPFIIFHGKSQINPKHFEEIVRKMLSWLEKMLHPDEQIPLFNDSAFNIAVDYSQIKDYFQKIIDYPYQPAEMSTTCELIHSGYVIFRTANQFLVIDGGKLGVSYQPGHAHCDLFSYEYSLHRKRFVVDGGVGNYLPSSLRLRSRSIYSHNTVVVNKLEQAEIWKAFRMGRRVKPERIQLVKSEDGQLFSGIYSNKLKQSLAYSHERQVKFIDGEIFIILDKIMAVNIHSIESLIHVHPDCQIDKEDGKIFLKNGATTAIILWDPLSLKLEIRRWFYVPEFGTEYETSMLVFTPLIDNLDYIYYVITPLDGLQKAQNYIESKYQHLRK